MGWQSGDLTGVQIFSRENSNCISHKEKNWGWDEIEDVWERVGSFKYLGVIFDSRVTWADHIRKIEDKCKKVINVMRCLTGRDWGASCSALKTIYVAMIRSVFDYGCIVYGSAAVSLLRKLDVIQAKALRVHCKNVFELYFIQFIIVLPCSLILFVLLFQLIFFHLLNCLK